jgi:hypothetical protein
MAKHKIPKVPRENRGDAADVARLKGWTVGTRLVGDEGYGPTVIEITAIGEKRVLAKQISEDRHPHQTPEGHWTFSCRDWQIVKS